jgi:hypothetical protein
MDETPGTVLLAAPAANEKIGLGFGMVTMFGITRLSIIAAADAGSTAGISTNRPLSLSGFGIAVNSELFAELGI